ncbi:hypothetical protein [Mycobacterium kansasii]|uniref:hypothetical protein n=1 Tax=Mycobacterium kansasii TaxID=1768 RepID=UPI0004D4D305|nr:hypothetical protein [Mycobacterium kansasii]KEP41936.1 hypothetical protein MKSMC1_29340 [Mycobacterium kansasii]
MSRWAVTYLEPNDRVNQAAGYITVVLDQPSEAAARQVFADQVRVAETLDYAGVQLRCDGSVVERWPVVTGDDPDLSDLRRAAALISHRATTDQEGLHWSLAEAAEAGRLVQLLRAVDGAYRVVIWHFGADAQAIDEQIQRFTNAEAADSFDVYNRHAARAIMAMRAEDRAALNEVFNAVNREAAGPRLVGGVCDVYAGLLPVLSTPEGQEFLSTWTARITGLEDQFN